MQVKINLTEWNAAIKFIVPCLSKDDTRPLLTGAHIVRTGDRLKIEACNGVSLAEICIPCQASDAEPKDFDVTADNPRALIVKVGRRDSPVGILTVGDKTLTVGTITGASQTVRLLSGTYLDTGRVWPTDDPENIKAFDPELLAPMLQAFSAVKSSPRILAILSSHGKMAGTVITTPGNDTARMLILPCRV